MAEDRITAPPRKRLLQPRGGYLNPPNWKFSQEVAESIIGAIAAGAHIGTACDLAGITHKTYCDWVKRGGRLLLKAKQRAEAAGAPMEQVFDYVDPPEERGFALFVDRLRKAFAQGQITYLSFIRRAAQKQWQAAAWMLERRWPEEWGRRRLEITGQDGEPVGGTTVSVYLPSNAREDTVTGVVVRQRTLRPTLDQDGRLLEGTVATDDPGE